MISVGEQSGYRGDARERRHGLRAAGRGDRRRADLDHRPILVLFMGGGVATVVFAILMPILQMNQFIR